MQRLADKLILRHSGRVTAYPEVIPKKCDSVRIGDDTPGTKNGRLRPSVSQQQAQAELEALAKHWPPGPGGSRESMVAEVLPMNDLLVGKIRRSLLIFMGTVAFVMLIACANVANQLLMRGTSRQREYAVRNALQSSRLRLAFRL
jgi:putative ABC transport system permease protein